MRLFLQYIKAYCTKGFIYIGVLPGALDIMSVYLPARYRIQVPLTFSVGVFAVACFVASFQIWKEAINKNKRPKIIIDYDLSVSTVIYLEIKNIGNDYAKDIQIRFNPDVDDLGNKKINEKSCLENLSQLAPGKSIRFLFGSFTDDRFLQKFRITITFYDLGKKRKYTETQFIDFSSLLDAVPPENSTEVIVGELKNITKKIGEMASNYRETNEILKNGISIRNFELSMLSTQELSQLLKNITRVKRQEDMFLKPYLYDTLLIIKTFRSKLMSKNSLTLREKRILNELNTIHYHHLVCGDNESYSSAFDLLKDIL